MRELRYAALLHDFGKVGVREQVLVKAKKLYAYELEIIRQRFHNTRTLIKMKAYRDLLTLGEERLSDPRLLAQRRRDIEQSLDAECARLNRFLTLVQYANEPTVAETDVTPELADVAAYRYLDEDGRERPLIYDFELHALTLAKGSLGPEERLQIESHVTHTFAFLSLIPWTKTLANLPDIAYAHHEKLDGSGYPRGLRSDQIPVQSKIMTIADIYDALTAGDRPYKHGLPSDQALDILHAEVKSGKIDNELYRVFVDSQAYRLK
jgi:3',5'-cyclic-nucleotide phosphodiesterase